MRNFRRLIAQVKLHQICTLRDCFCWKYIKFQQKKVWRKYVSWYQRTVENLKKNLFFVSEMTTIWWILIRALKSLKNICTLISLFCAKYKTFDLKRYRGVTFHDTEESCKIWRKTDLWFEKWLEEFGKFSSEHLKVSKLVFSWDPFVQSRKFMRYSLQRSYK